MDRFRLDGTAAIVTGGNRGLGNAMAGALAEAGADVAIACRDVAMGTDAAAELERENGVDAFAVEADVREEADVAAMVEETVDRLGGVDVLVNNAGIGGIEPAVDISTPDWQAIIDTNLTGAFLCSRHAGRHMIENGGGSIVNISSIAGQVARHPQIHVAYESSKGGLNMLTRGLASEWAEHGIRVNAIAPGYMKTDQVVPVAEEHPEWLEAWLSAIPMDRLGEPDELGGLVVFLASDASSYLTGQIVACDGGYTAR